MGVYYNENHEQKAAWLRELIRQNVVAPGEVDERSIAEVRPDDLRGFKQCHFFAGVGCWSYALRLAGWPDDRPCWTGSCPCPSFSCAGKGEGFDDPRHLWPVWYPLICECRPGVVFGEQADAAIGHGWLDLVSTDLEAQEYAFASAVLGAHSVGAGHRRQRLYFAGVDSHAESGRLQQHDAQEREFRITDAGRESGSGPNSNVRQSSNGNLQRSGEQRLLAKDSGTGNGYHSAGDGCESGHPVQREHDGLLPDDGRGSGNGSQSIGTRLEGFSGHVRDWRGPGWIDPLTARSVAEAGATRGFWGDCDWWHARDGKYRPIEPGIFPLAHGAANRVLKLRGYGDAIVPQCAEAFIRSYIEAEEALNL